jgi:hypothetical protein
LVKEVPEALLWREKTEGCDPDEIVTLGISQVRGIIRSRLLRRQQGPRNLQRGRRIERSSQFGKYCGHASAIVGRDNASIAARADDQRRTRTRKAVAVLERMADDDASKL